MKALFLIMLLSGVAAKADQVCVFGGICTYSADEMKAHYEKVRVQQDDEDQRLMEMRGSSDLHLYVHSGKEAPAAAVKPEAKPVFDENQPFEEVTPEEPEAHTHAMPPEYQEEQLS